MSIPGPWVQPADTTVDLGAAQSALIQSESLSPSDLSTAADGSGEWSHDSGAAGGSDLFWNWQKTTSGWNAAQALGVFDLATGPQFPAVPPTPAELAQPHVIGYELESAYGVSLGSGILRYTNNSGDGWSFFNLNSGELTAFRVRIAAAPSYTYPPADFSWWGAFGATILDVPTAAFGTVTSSGGVTYGSTLAVAAAVLQQLALTDWAATPTSGGPGAVVGVFGSLGNGLRLRADYRPPRYRLLYDTLAPLRQFPRDDPLGGAPRQFGRSRSVQNSPRAGWSGAYR